MTRRYVDFARYNQWANRRLYDAASRLSDEQYRADQGAFFGSLHGTLNHLLVTDDLWMARFRGVEPPPHALDSILFDRFSELHDARDAMDRRILDYVHALDEAALAAPITYRTVTNPARITQPLAPALDHFFNHQTHHRGQAHILLTRLTGRAPSFDLILFQRETGLGGVTMEPV